MAWTRENDCKERGEKKNSFRNYQHLPFDFCSFRRCSAIFLRTFAEIEEHLEVYFIETIFSQGRGGTETCDDSSIGSCVRTSVTEARATLYMYVRACTPKECVSLYVRIGREVDSASSVRRVTRKSPVDASNWLSWL